MMFLHLTKTLQSIFRFKLQQILDEEILSEEIKHNKSVYKGDILPDLAQSEFQRCTISFQL